MMFYYKTIEVIQERMIKMSILKYVFNKKYREETKRKFSYQITDRINSSNRKIEMIYKEILRNRKMAA